MSPFKKVIDYTLGYSFMEKPLTLLVKGGLRGLGVNVGYNIYQSGEAWFLKRLLASVKDPVCLDIGANEGKYAVACLRYGAKAVYSFEPSPKTFDILCSNVSAFSAIRPINAAVGEVNGTTNFSVPDDDKFSVLASRDQTITDLPTLGAKIISVRMTTIDAFCGEYRISPDFIKIDVEGFEFEVLSGASLTIRNTRPSAIQFEFNTHNMRRRQPLEIFRELLPGYRLFRLASHSLRALDANHYLSNIFAYSNIIAVRDDFPLQFG